MSIGPLETPLLPGSPRPHVGVFRGTVVDNRDPLGMGRVALLVPAVTGDDMLWAIPVVAMAGPDAGVRFIPEPGDRAIVAFEAGDPRFPVVLGYYWDEPGTAPIPPTVHVLRSRTAASIEIDELLPVVTVRAGGSTVTVAPEGVTVTVGESVLSVTEAGVSVAAPAVDLVAEGALRLSGSDVSIEASAVSMDGADIDISAGNCRIEAGLVTIN